MSSSLYLCWWWQRKVCASDPFVYRSQISIHLKINYQTYVYFPYDVNLSKAQKMSHACCLFSDRVATTAYLISLFSMQSYRGIFHQDETKIRWLPKWTAVLDPCKRECMQTHNKSFLVSASWRASEDPALSSLFQGNIIWVTEAYVLSLSHILPAWSMQTFYILIYIKLHILFGTACTEKLFQILIKNKKK